MIDQNQHQALKQPYTSPVVHVYGDIRAITQAVGNTGNGDGGSVAGQKKSKI